MRWDNIYEYFSDCGWLRYVQIQKCWTKYVDRKFIDAIFDLANDKKKREMLGRNTFGLARAKYSRVKMQAKMDEMLTKLKKSDGWIKVENECEE